MTVTFGGTDLALLLSAIAPATPAPTAPILAAFSPRAPETRIRKLVGTEKLLTCFRNGTLHDCSRLFCR